MTSEYPRLDKQLKLLKMKTSSIIILLMLSSFALKAQTETAYNYYTINQTLAGKDVYVFTTAKPFKYVKGAAYVFGPPEFEKIAQRSIENKLKSMDPSFNGLYVNQISNGTRTCLQNFENTNQEIKDKMLEVYNYQKNQSYRSNNVIVVLIDIDTGASLAEYSLASTSLKSRNGSQGNAY